MPQRFHHFGRVIQIAGQADAHLGVAQKPVRTAQQRHRRLRALAEGRLDPTRRIRVGQVRERKCLRPLVSQQEQRAQGPCTGVVKLATQHGVFFLGFLESGGPATRQQPQGAGALPACGHGLYRPTGTALIFTHTAVTIDCTP
ncbi:hypothetical protein D3C72_1578340 [compost metagenome]